MRKFYLFLWLRWMFWLTFLSLSLAIAGAGFITVIIYMKQGAVSLNGEIYSALFAIFRFWFAIFWSATLLLSLFLTLKILFNHCYGNFKLILLTCSDKKMQSQQIEQIGYGDLVKVWRKWFMLLIWLVTVQVIVVFIFMKLFFHVGTLFDWFNIYVLYLFLLISGYFSFMILGVKCKKIKVVKC